MKRHLLTIILTSLITMAQAGIPKWIQSVVQWVDSSDVAGCDTSYVMLPREGFTAYLNTYFSGNRTIVNMMPDDALTLGLPEIAGTLRTRPATMVSAGLYYRGWGLSYSHDFKRYGDTDFTYSFYGKRYGLEYRYHSSYTLHGDLELEDRIIPIEERLGRMRTTIINGYYVFDNNRFSHPAATTHTTIQKRSAGSWLASFNYWHGSYRSYSNLILQEFGHISLSHFNLGAGYAYNYVFAHEHCLLQSSLTPMFTIWHRNRFYYDLSDMALSQYLAFDLVAHLHFVYNHGRYLTGFQSIINYSMSPRIGEFSINTFDWMSRVFLGVRF